VADTTNNAKPMSASHVDNDYDQSTHGSQKWKPQSGPWIAIDVANCAGERGILLVKMALDFRQDLLFTIAQRHGSVLLDSDDCSYQHSRRLPQDCRRTVSRQGTVHSVYEMSAVS
jgi:hypothetical protein